MRTKSTLHRAPVGQGPPGPGWLAISFGFWSGRALATGTAWAGLCLIHHQHHRKLPPKTFKPCTKRDESSVGRYKSCDPTPTRTLRRAPVGAGTCVVRVVAERQFPWVLLMPPPQATATARAGLCLRQQCANHAYVTPAGRTSCSSRARSCDGPRGSVSIRPLGLAGQRSLQARRALVSLASIAEWPVNNRCVSAPHDDMRHVGGRVTDGADSPASGRVVGPREGGGSLIDARLVALASTNLGGSCHCEWPSA